MLTKDEIFVFDRLCYEHRLLGLVQQFHAPFSASRQPARNAAEQVGAYRLHLGPGRLAVLALIWMIGRAGIAALADAKEV